MSLLCYDLCNQTVTVYRKTKDGVLRMVLPGCAYFPKASQKVDPVGKQTNWGFLLIVPGDREIRPDDRVLLGEGPVFTRWAELYDVPLVGSVNTYYWENRVCHREGRGG